MLRILFYEAFISEVMLGSTEKALMEITKFVLLNKGIFSIIFEWIGCNNFKMLLGRKK